MQRTWPGCLAGLGLAVCLSVWLQASSSDSRVADAAMGGDASTVKSLLKQGADVNAAQGDGMTALHWAARQGDVDLTRMLVYAGANVRAVTRLGGYTPLLMASERGYASVMDELLKAGSDPKIATSSGTTPRRAGTTGCAPAPATRCGCCPGCPGRAADCTTTGARPAC